MFIDGRVRVLGTNDLCTYGQPDAQTLLTRCALLLGTSESTKMTSSVSQCTGQMHPRGVTAAPCGRPDHPLSLTAVRRARTCTAAAPASSRRLLQYARKHSRAVQCRAAAPQRTKLDSSMIWGDIMMLTATELASERLPKQVTGVLSLTLLAAWIGVSALQ